MLTAKQEAFALAIVEGYNQSDAYRRAYDAERMLPATVWKRASELSQDRAVAGRIAELSQQIADQAVQATIWTVERIIRELAHNAEIALAQRKPQVAAANQALIKIGEHIGMWPSRPQDQPREGDRHLHLHGLSTDELRQRARELLSDAGS